VDNATLVDKSDLGFRQEVWDSVVLFAISCSGGRICDEFQQFGEDCDSFGEFVRELSLRSLRFMIVDNAVLVDKNDLGFLIVGGDNVHR